MTVMTKFLRRFGIDAKQFYRAARGLPLYNANKRAFYRQWKDSGDSSFVAGEPFPCLHDRFEQAGMVGGHYFHQDLLVAQMIYKNGPERHVDVGSRIDGFVAHVAAFRDIDVFDLRPIVSNADRIRFQQCNFMEPTPELEASTDSLSCLHVLEHFGLGRYGDEVDYYGHIKGFRNLARMVKPSGKFYFSTPIGKTQRFQFDAHRVFSLPYLLEMIRDNAFVVDSFYVVDDSGVLLKNIGVNSDQAKDTFGLRYGCGIFELTRPLS